MPKTVRTTEKKVGYEAHKWIKALMGIGVSIPVALAPLLGRLNIPGFTPLLSLIPDEIQDVAIPMSAGAMSLVAASVEFRAISGLARDLLWKQARRSLMQASLCLAAFGIAYLLLVTRVGYAGTESVAFVTGFVHPNTPPCVNKSAEECIRYLTLSPPKITSHFGDEQIRLARILLGSLYVLFFAVFGNLVGILVALRKPESGSK